MDSPVSNPLFGLDSLNELRRQTILMHGPLEDGSGEIVERHIPVMERAAYMNAGFVEGANPSKKLEEAVEAVVDKKVKGKK